HARDLPELAFRTPETAEPEHRLLETGHRRLLDEAAVDEVFAVEGQRRVAARKRLVVGRHGGLLAEEGHEGLLDEVSGVAAVWGRCRHYSRPHKVPVYYG